MYIDKELLCLDCDMNFILTEGEQQFYSARGLYFEPDCCHECRAVKNEKTKEFRHTDYVEYDWRKKTSVTTTAKKPFYCGDCDLI